MGETMGRKQDEELQGEGEEEGKKAEERLIYRLN
jgi:hypothetical protein